MTEEEFCSENCLAKGIDECNDCKDKKLYCGTHSKVHALKYDHIMVQATKKFDVSKFPF